MSSIETAPVSPQEIERLFQQASDNVKANLRGTDEDGRSQALRVARSLVASLENPQDVVMRYVWERMALRVGIDLRLFHILVEKNGTAISAVELAQRCKAETLLIIRIMRVITAIEFAAEAGTQSYVATPLTKAMIKPALEAAAKLCHDNSALVQMTMHQFFREKGYKVPTNDSDGAFQWTFNTKQSFFEHIHSDPDRSRDFNTFMSGSRSTRSHWTDWFPVESEIISGAINGANDILLVDVGGGNGHDLIRFLNKYPSAWGRLILQGLPNLIQNLEGLSLGIQAMAHDFFTPQAIKDKWTPALDAVRLLTAPNREELGARVYYLHFVLHDWPDDKCRHILRNLMTAMRPGYSKILLNESVLPNTDCPLFLAAGDINMMSIMGGKKRTEGEWEELLRSVDLHVVKIWKSPNPRDEEAVIEAVLPAFSKLPG